ncbi:MAG: YbjQ family protein [Caldisericota bacterium]|nr:YbjQ family protein [Caldisericota bacterium]
MKAIRLVGSLAFVVGLFTAIFIGVPWYVYHEPILPWWLKIAMYCLFGGILLVLLTLSVEQKKEQAFEKETSYEELRAEILFQSSSEIPGRNIKEVLGMVQGHTIYAIWIGRDLSAIVRLILGGELIEYTEMMGKARSVAIARMMAHAKELGADAIINVRFVTTSVIGSAAELLAYGTAVKLNELKS